MKLAVAARSGDVSIVEAILQEPQELRLEQRFQHVLGGLGIYLLLYRFSLIAATLIQRDL